jgi:hypothetical protein
MLYFSVSVSEMKPTRYGLAASPNRCVMRIETASAMFCCRKGARRRQENVSMHGPTTHVDKIPSRLTTCGLMT